MSELADLLNYRKELPRHLRELGVLVRRTVAEADLLSLEETRELRARANQVERRPVVAFEMPFANRSGSEFRVFVERLVDANPADVYVWTPASNFCGVLRPVPFRSVDIDFPFDLIPEGIIVILTSDLHDRLLLDYSVGDEGEQLLDVEVSGEHWGTLPVPRQGTRPGKA